MRFMISQPMGGLADVEIMRKKNEITEFLSSQGHEVVDSFYKNDLPDNIRNPSLFLLGASLMDMAKCDAVYFCRGWKEARGCIIEHDVALAYNMRVVYEEE